MSKRDLISIEDLSNAEILAIFKIADRLSDTYLHRTSLDVLSGKIMATLFYEPSTRTRLSFEAAMLRLGGHVITSADMQSSSSASKGETIADSAKVISQYADILVIRHPLAGSTLVASRHSDVPVINAGDGAHEHPTQTLCDLYTLYKEKGEIKGLTVALCGDLKFGRTIHSFAAALARFGAHLVLIPGEHLQMPEHLLRKLAVKHDQKLQPADLTPLKESFKHFDAVYMAPQGSPDHSTSLDAIYINARALDEPSSLETIRFQMTPTGVTFTPNTPHKIRGVDIVYMTRHQKERLSRDLSSHHYPRLDADALASSPFKKAIVMHPLPRVDEIATEVDADPRSRYFAQVSYGVVVRMALLHFLFEESRTAIGSQQPTLPGLDSRQPNLPTLDTRTLNRPPIYRNTFGIGPMCQNDNCITGQKHEHAVPEFSILTREKTYTSHLLILECCYCDFEVSVSVVGNKVARRFCEYDPALEDSVEQWLADGVLILFKNVAEAKGEGFIPYAQDRGTSVMTSEDVAQTIEVLAKEIEAQVSDLSNLCLVGVKRRGDVLARRIASAIERHASMPIPVGSLDVLPFRDDVHTVPEPANQLDFSIENKVVVLVDDVFYSGRTTRAAIKALLLGARHGRPTDIKVAVLIDRGHRELPIQPQFVGKRIPTSKMERVSVKLADLPEHQEDDEVVRFRILMEDRGSRRSSRRP